MTTQDPPRTEAATLAELRSALPDAGSDFWISQLDAGATMAQATANYAAQLRQQNEQLLADAEAERQRHADELAAAQARSASPPGVVPLGESIADPASDGGEPSGNPIEDFDAAVRSRMAGGLARSEAVKRVARADPQLHQAYLLATNHDRKSRRLLAEKYDLEV